MSSQLVNSNHSFVVFADTTPKAHKPHSSRARHDKLGCAVLQELNTNKPFVLSPKSQISAEKENFDPVEKQIVAYRRAKSQLPPLGERTESYKNKCCAPSAATLTAARATSVCKKPNAPGDVDDLVLLLSDIEIGDATPCRSSGKAANTQLRKQRCQEQPPPVLRLGPQSKHMYNRANETNTNLQPRPSKEQSAVVSSKRNSTKPRQQTRQHKRPVRQGVSSPPDLRSCIR